MGSLFMVLLLEESQRGSCLPKWLKSHLWAGNGWSYVLPDLRNIPYKGCDLRTSFVILAGRCVMPQRMEEEKGKVSLPSLDVVR